MSTNNDSSLLLHHRPSTTTSSTPPPTVPMQQPQFRKNTNNSNAVSVVDCGSPNKDSSPQQQQSHVQQQTPPPTPRVVQQQGQQFMSVMIDKGVTWWCEQISGTNAVTLEMIKRFEKLLNEALTEKLKNHWFPEYPTKGQGYRSLCIDKQGHTDPVLLKASKAAGIENIYDCFSWVESIVMWIDPHEVAVKISYAFVKDYRAKEQILYKQPTPLPSPIPSPSLIKSSSSSHTSNPIASNPTTSPLDKTPPKSLILSPPRLSPVRAPIASSTPVSPYMHLYSPSYQVPRPPSPIQPVPFPHSHKKYPFQNRAPMYPGGNGGYRVNNQNYNNWTSGEVGCSEQTWGKPTDISQPQQAQHQQTQQQAQQQAQQQTQQAKVYFWNSGMPLEAQA